MHANKSNQRGAIKRAAEEQEDAQSRRAWQRKHASSTRTDEEVGKASSRKATAKRRAEEVDEAQSNKSAKDERCQAVGGGHVQDASRRMQERPPSIRRTALRTIAARRSKEKLRS